MNWQEKQPEESQSLFDLARFGNRIMMEYPEGSISWIFGRALILAREAQLQGIEPEWGAAVLKCAHSSAATLHYNTESQR